MGTDCVDEDRRGSDGDAGAGAPDLTPTAGAKALRPRRGGARTGIVDKVWVWCESSVKFSVVLEAVERGEDGLLDEASKNRKLRRVQGDQTIANKVSNISCRGALVTSGCCPLAAASTLCGDIYPFFIQSYPSIS